MKEKNVLKDITFFVEHNNAVICFSENSSTLKSHDGPVVKLLHNNNQDDTSMDFRYALWIEEDNQLLNESAIRNMADDAYLSKVVARFYNKPLEIIRTNRLLIKELSAENAPELEELCDKDSVAKGYIESFFENDDELKAILNRYANEVYDFYEAGIWGIFSENKLIGIAGLTPKEYSFNDDVKVILDREMESELSYELSYVIKKCERGNGYCTEACSAILRYANDNIEFDKIFSVIAADNKASLCIANKLIKQF